MSGLWHPVGPQPAAIYWWRRAFVLGVVAGVIALLVALLTPAPKQRAVPAAPSSAVLATTATTDPSGSATRSPASPARAPSSRTPEDSPSAKTSSKGATSSPSRAKGSRAEGPKGKKSKTRAERRVKPVSCAPSRLRVKLDAPGALTAGEPATFSVSVVNGSGARCTARISGDNFEVRIFSGRDRIWSSADCPKAIKPLKQTMAAERAMTWPLKWNGRRSAPTCDSRPEKPLPGTYITTAQLSGADPVQARTILRG